MFRHAFTLLSCGASFFQAQDGLSLSSSFALHHLLTINPGFNLHDKKTIAALNISEADLEAEWGVVKPHTIVRKLVIGNIYRPPSGNGENFLKLLTEMLESMQDLPNRELHLLWDFNIDLIKTQLSKDLLLIKQAGLT